MMKTAIFAIFTALTCAALPATAFAWSEEPAPVNADGSNHFTDPDQQSARMVGRDENGDPTSQGQIHNFKLGNGSGLSFSVSHSGSSDNANSDSLGQPPVGIPGYANPLQQR